ncbi:MAG: sigma 54-interacting transcriptional regulator [Desulfotalea sp.]
MINKTTFPFNKEVIQQLLLDMAQQRSTSQLFDLVVTRLTDFSSIALARIWVLRPGDICNKCLLEPECRNKTNCLHLLASSGQSTVNPEIHWRDIHGQHSRFPLGVRKVGHIATTGKPVIVEQINDDSKWIVHLEWAKKEKIQGFAGQPLIFQGKVLGVLAIFTQMPLTSPILNELRTIADHAAAALSNALAFEKIEQLKKKLESENTYLREELFDISSQGSFVGQSDLIQQMLNRINLVSSTNASVLIQGESGTGKELVAQEIHHRSERNNKPLIKVNCASIPRDLFESEFFGHAKGAFSSAINSRDGRFYAADGGTLFLDEIGEIPLEHQGKLLRILQEGEYERVGEDHTRSTDVRIIAATNKDLKKEVKAGKFREDLYFRLNVFPIRVAPLRERKEDIEPLAIHFLKLALRKMNRPKQRLNTHHLQQLQNYDWPGNVRELQNIIERTAIFADSGPLQIQLPESMTNTRIIIDLDQTTEILPFSDNQPIFTEKEMVALQKENTKAALEKCNWKIYGNDGAAAMLDIKPTTLATRITKMNLKKECS